MRFKAEQINADTRKSEPESDAGAYMPLFGSSVKIQSGFTLVELVTVVVILGIISVAAISRFADNSQFQERGTADQIRAALRYGQKVAIAQHRDVNVSISLAATSNCGAQLTGGDVNCAVLNSVAVTPVTVSFNAMGQPTPNGAVIGVGTSTSITVEAETGYVH